ncbi:uncharacterized protein UDID_19470 [Ustilago sp. UG-2017a]|nr:uncharacterized protein UDID_19470 [Ustilago sp. UG-2017a]
MRPEPRRLVPSKSNINLAYRSIDIAKGTEAEAALERISTAAKGLVECFGINNCSKEVSKEEACLEALEEFADVQPPIFLDSQNSFFGASLSGTFGGLLATAIVLILSNHAGDPAGQLSLPGSSALLRLILNKAQPHALARLSIPSRETMGHKDVCHTRYASEANKDEEATASRRQALQHDPPRSFQLSGQTR